MRVLPGLSLVLLLLAGCSSHGSARPSGSTASATPTSASPSARAVGPTVSGRSVRIDLTSGPARAATGLRAGENQRTLYYRPRGAPARVAVTTNGGVFTAQAFQVSVTPRPVGSPAPSPNDTAPAYLLVLSHYDSAQAAVRAVRSQVDALGLDATALGSGAQPPKGAVRGVPGGGVAVVVTIGRDPDYGGYQVSWDLGAP